MRLRVSGTGPMRAFAGVRPTARGRRKIIVVCCARAAGRKQVLHYLLSNDSSNQSAAAAALDDGVEILPRRPKDERALALRLYVDHAPRALEERDLLPRDASVLLQSQASAVDSEPGDVVSIGCRVAPTLADLEPNMEIVERSE